MIAYLGLGSNLGNRQYYMSKAIESINAHTAMKITGKSEVIETAAYGLTEQADFLNQVVKIETELTAEKLLAECQKIENELKRVRSIKWGPRTMDIDILFYGDQVMKTAELQIPHPDLHNREFVLRSMLELNSELVHPVLEQSMQEIYNNLEVR